MLISIPLRYNLELYELEQLLPAQKNFNSTKVQFGVHHLRYFNNPLCYFNSTKVQFGDVC